ncbi:MAG: glycoside hydrolase family 25 protein [Bergeyella zoohelcum]|nr:glycoside hydrolase family 25 protein [Bergeyella zoohelcum]
MKKKRSTKRNTTRKRHQKRKSHWLFRRWTLLLILVISLLGTGYYLKEKIAFYYAMYFTRYEHKSLKNNAYESKRIRRIISENTDKTFGIDISHYQNPEDIQWDSLSIANKSVPIKFVVLRATMGKNSKDRHFKKYWAKAKKHNLIRGAYHFYRPNEDPVKQANNFLESVKLESGDLVPVLDIEKKSSKYSRKELIENLKTWLKIVEENYGQKPIIYTYYYYHRDVLQDELDGYPLWLANYNDVSTPSPNSNWDFWQFTENGIVEGINTKVDVNIFNGNTSDLKDLTIQKDK